MKNNSWKYIAYVILAIGLIYLANFGYQLSVEKQHSDLAAVTDRDLQKDVQNAFAASDAYAHENISVAVHGGIAVLSGTVHESWKREGAANIASALPGIVSVTNSIQLRNEAAEQEAAPAAATEDTAPRAARVKKARAIDDSPEARAQAFVDDGNLQITRKNYDAAIKDFQAALALQPGNYEAQSGLQEAKNLR